MTKIINTQEELEDLIVEGQIVIKGDLILKCNIDIDNDIQAKNIQAFHIKARNIDAYNIDAKNIQAKNIEALDINTWNIDAWNIDAWNIKYHTVCFARESFKCISIKGSRENSRHFCLDGEINVTGDSMNNKDLERCVPYFINYKEIAAVFSKYVFRGMVAVILLFMLNELRFQSKLLKDHKYPITATVRSGLQDNSLEPSNTRGDEQ